MRNVKLTLATALSVLALTFAGTASADNNKYNNHKQKNQISKPVTKKNVTKKQVVVKNNVKKAPAKQVVVTKKVVTKKVAAKPVKTQVVKKNYSNNKKTVTIVSKQSSYTVRSGDTLSRIAIKTGVSVKKLAKLNNLKHVNNIRIGQILRTL